MLENVRANVLIRFQLTEFFGVNLLRELTWREEERLLSVAYLGQEYRHLFILIIYLPIV